MKELVIAKYKEDVEWARSVPDDWDITVYDKEVDVPNIGRDSHTFLYHICLRYHSLADLTVFSQGRYDDHCEDLIGRMKLLKHGEGYTHLSDRIFHVAADGNNFWEPNVEKISGYQETFGLPNERLTFPYGAFLAVDKENVLKRPLNFYLNLLTLVSNKGQNAAMMEYFWHQVLG